MKGKQVITRPNRKVTEFFVRKPRTGPRPDQPVYDVSSSSERSVISISSDEVPQTTRLSQTAPPAGPSSRVVPQPATKPRPSGDTRSSAVYVSSSSQSSRAASPPAHIISSSWATSMTRASTRSADDPVMSKVPPKRVAPSMHKTNGKKRKQPPVNVISSDSSDGPVDPVIRVGQSSSRSRSLHPSIDAVIAATSAPVPLSPKQNILSSSTRPAGKADPKVLSQPSPIKTPEQHHQPSPPKRARHGSLSTSEKRCLSTPCDADDEDEFEPAIPSARKPWKTTPSIQGSSDDRMHVDAQPASTSGPVINDEGHDESGEGPKTQSTQPTMPWQVMQDVLPSNQQDEVELSMDQDPIEMETAQAPEHPPPPSPSKSRAEGIIARIKAKAAADALEEQAQIERKRSLGLLDGEGDTSDLSSISSQSDEDDAELEFDLNAYRKPNVTNSGSAASTSLTHRSSPLTHRSSRTPETAGTRHSTRHESLSAPNYAKKLELFREDTPPLSNQKGKGPLNGKGQSGAPSCPLDILIKDHEREDARRAKAEKNRKGPASVRDSSPVVPNQHSGVFETPGRPGRRPTAASPGSDISSSPGDRVGEDTLMGDAEREELLGKEDGKAVGKILAGDRARKSKGAKKEEKFVFWDAVQQGSKDVAPELTLSDEHSPVLQSLQDKIKIKDYQAASLFINSGILTVVPSTVQFLEWLFLTAMSTASPVLSTAAYRALLVCHRADVGQKDPAKLTFGTLLASLIKFGVNPRICTLLGAGTVEMITTVEASGDTKTLTICRLIMMLEALGRANAVESDAMPLIILTLLLLALDPSAGPELQQDVVHAIESLLGSRTCTRVGELSICKTITHAMASLEFTPEQEAELLALLPGCGSSSGRVRRWTAWAILGGDLSSVQECGDIPPFEVLTKLFTNKPTGKVRLDVVRDTDYEVLGARIEVLSIALTDVDAYARTELSTRGLITRSIDGICKELEWMNGKIVDTRAAHLDRTRTKDAINRLHKRLVYQYSAIEEQSRGKAGTLDNFITKISSGVGSKPKPKPVAAGDILG